MTYEFHTDTDQKLFDRFVMASDQNTLFQCSDWLKIKTNWQGMLTSVTEAGEIVAAGLVLIRQMPLGTTLFYLPRGPVMDYHNRELLEFYFAGLKKTARQKKAIAIRFDPAVLSRCYDYRQRHEDHPYMNQDIIDALKQLGAVHRGFTVKIEESTQPRFNAAMTVDPDYRERLEHKTMKCIRAAEHKGIEVLEGPEYIPAFAQAMHYTEVRKKVALRNEEYFRNMMNVYGDRAICMVTRLRFPEQLQKLREAIAVNTEKLAGQLSKKERAAVNQQLQNDQKELQKLEQDYEREGRDEVITSGILAVYNDSLMELFYMGNHPDYLRMYSSYLLYARCLDRCVDLGIRHCSFGGIEGTLDDGLTLFKSNWLMQVEEYIGEFNIVLNPFMYSLFDKVYPYLLKTAAKLRGRES